MSGFWIGAAYAVLIVLLVGLIGCFRAAYCSSRGAGLRGVVYDSLERPATTNEKARCARAGY